MDPRRQQQQQQQQQQMQAQQQLVSGQDRNDAANGARQLTTACIALDKNKFDKGASTGLASAAKGGGEQGGGAAAMVSAASTPVAKSGGGASSRRPSATGSAEKKTGIKREYDKWTLKEQEAFFAGMSPREREKERKKERERSIVAAR